MKGGGGDDGDVTPIGRKDRHAIVQACVNISMCETTG